MEIKIKWQYIVKISNLQIKMWKYILFKVQVWLSLLILVE